MAALQGTSSPDDQYIENGRGYSRFRRGQYLLPVDQKEQDRLDIMHTVILAARPKEKRLHHAPFREQIDPVTRQPLSRVLDLGHGTSLWLVQMADKYAVTDFRGLDIVEMSPPHVYQNICLHVPVDYESPWTLGEDSFDLVHMQMGLGSVSNWMLLYDKIYKHLKPGGWFEHVEIDWEPRSDDGTLPPSDDDPSHPTFLSDWWHKYIKEPFRVVGRPLDYNPNTGGMLRERGFVNINHEHYRIPFNGWASKKEEHVSGLWFENAMDSGENKGHGFEALSLAVLTRIQRWPVEHARQLCADAFAEAREPSVHAYATLHIWWAQRPG